MRTALTALLLCALAAQLAAADDAWLVCRYSGAVMRDCAMEGSEKFDDSTLAKPCCCDRFETDIPELAPATQDDPLGKGQRLVAPPAGHVAPREVDAPGLSAFMAPASGPSERGRLRYLQLRHLLI